MMRKKFFPGAIVIVIAMAFLTKGFFLPTWAGDPPESMEKASVSIHLENIRSQEDVDLGASIEAQLYSRAWPGHQTEWSQMNLYSLLNWIPPEVNANGAFFGGWTSVARINAENEFGTNYMNNPTFLDFTTRDPQGDLYEIPSIYDSHVYNGDINNEDYLDYIMENVREQIDNGINCIHFDERHGSYDGIHLGYGDYTIGTANFCSVRTTRVDPSAVADSSIGQHSPSLAIDGDPSTYWISGKFDSHWIEIDLSRPRTIQQISLSLDPDPSSRLRSYQIFYWDGSDWIDFDPPIVEQDNSRSHPSYLIHPVTTEKLKLISTQIQVRLGELEAYGRGFRQYLIDKYGPSYDWEGTFDIDLSDPEQCPDGSIYSFNYREYLKDHGWANNPASPYGSDIMTDVPANPLWDEFGVMVSRRPAEWRFWVEGASTMRDFGEYVLAQRFYPHQDGLLVGARLYLYSHIMPVSDAIVEVRTDEDGHPSSTILSNVRIRSEKMPEENSKQWVAAQFWYAPVSAGQPYWIVIHSLGGSGEYDWIDDQSGNGAFYYDSGQWIDAGSGFLIEIYNWSSSSESFFPGVMDRVWQHLANSVKSYDPDVYVTANGSCNAYVDYHDWGFGASDTVDENGHLDGRQVRMTLWKEQAKMARYFSSAPVFRFLDYGFGGFFFSDLPSSAEREAYLRIYSSEILAAGCFFSFPVRECGYRAKNEPDVLGAIREMASFYSFWGGENPFGVDIYHNLSQNPKEGLAMVHGVTPFNGDPEGMANSSGVSISLMDGADGNTYLHVINHDWDMDHFEMNTQTNVPVHLILEGTVQAIKIVSPDDAGSLPDSPKVQSIPFSYIGESIDFILPTLHYYDIAIIEPGDGGSSIEEVTGLVWENRTDFHWDDSPGASSYDIARGILSELLSTGDCGGASSFSCDQMETHASDPAAPPSGDGYYYLVRGHYGSEVGSWGNADRDESISACE